MSKIKVDRLETLDGTVSVSVAGLQAALDGKQATLVSGTNIKTINGQSLLGSGDLTISSGGGGGGALSFRNRIINGKMEIAQRGTSFAAIASGGYSLDRWIFENGTTAVITASQQADVPSGNEFQSSLRLDVTTADTSISSVDYCLISQRVEGYNARDLIGRTFALSFWVRSSKTGTHCVAFRNAVTGNSGDRSFVAEYTINSANTWEYKTVTVSGGLIAAGANWNWTTGAGLIVSFALASGTTFQTTSGAWQTGNFIATANQVNCLDTVGNSFAITGVQLEPGSYATQFEHRPYGLELALCQRYYEVVSFGSRSNNSPAWNNAIPEAIVVSFKQEKRATPTIAEISVGGASHARQYSADTRTVQVHPPQHSSGGWYFYGVVASATAEL